MNKDKPWYDSIMAKKEIVISFEELSRIEIECPNCNSTISLDVEVEIKKSFDHCVVCDEKLPVHLIVWVTNYQTFFQKAKARKAKIYFRIEAEKN